MIPPLSSACIQNVPKRRSLATLLGITQHMRKFVLSGKTPKLALEGLLPAALLKGDRPIVLALNKVDLLRVRARSATPRLEMAVESAFLSLRLPWSYISLCFEQETECALSLTPWLCSRRGPRVKGMC